MKTDRILVLARGSSADDPAVSRAFALARRFASHLTLLDVFDELPGEFEPLLSSLKTVDAREEAQRERRGQLHQVCSLLREHGVSADSDVRWGHPVEGLVQEAARGRHDLLVLEDDKPRGLHAVTQSIVRHAPVPVWVVKNAPHAPPPRVLAALDPIGGTPGTFDQRVLACAVRAAEAMGAELYVVHAWQPLHEAYHWLPDRVRRLSEQRDFVEETRMRHARAVERVVRSVLPRLSADRLRLVEGPAGPAVLDTIAAVGADLLVLGTARSAMYGHVLLGKTAETILEQVPVSVLAVKPDGSSATR